MKVWIRLEARGCGQRGWKVTTSSEPRLEVIEERDFPDFENTKRTLEHHLSKQLGVSLKITAFPHIAQVLQTKTGMVTLKPEQLELQLAA